MAAVYSKLFYNRGNLPAGTTSLFSVPAGYVYVIKDIVAVWTIAEFGIPGGGLTIEDADQSAVIFQMPSGGPVPGVMYHWFGTQVCFAGETIRAVASEGYYSVRISGHALTTP